MHHHWPFGDHSQAHMRRRGGFFGDFGADFLGGMRTARMLSSGDLQLLILGLLQSKPRHGYEIIKELEEHSSGLYTPSPGVVYPALTYLEEMGYAVSESEGNKKLFRITEAGAAHWEQNRAVAEEAMDQLARFGRRMSQFRRHFSEEQAEEEIWREGSREQNKEEWRRMWGEFHDLKREFKRALLSKMNAPEEEKRRVLEVLRRALEEVRGKVV